MSEQPPLAVISLRAEELHLLRQLLDRAEHAMLPEFWTKPNQRLLLNMKGKLAAAAPRKEHPNNGLVRCCNCMKSLIPVGQTLCENCARELYPDEPEEDSERTEE